MEARSVFVPAPERAGHSFTEEDLPVAKLEIDREVQRTNLDQRKVEHIVRNFNPNALQVVTVSRRNRDKGESYVILDGAHRVEAVRRLTDNGGTIKAHVFDGLTKPQEAAMFLNLNYSSQPPLMDKFRVRLVQGEEQAVRISRLLAAFGWKVDASPTDGNIQCIGMLEQIDKLSQKHEVEPHLLHAVILVVTRAWGTNRQGAQAVILGGLANVILEYSSNLDLDALAKSLARYKGGPGGLHTDAATLAALRKGRVAMAVAEQIVDHYNKGTRGGKLHAWRKRA